MNITAQPVAYDIATAVAVSGIGRTRLYAYIKAKRLKARKAGRRTVILAADLQAFLDSLPEMEAALSVMAFNAEPPRLATSAAQECVQLGSSNALYEDHRQPVRDRAGA